MEAALLKQGAVLGIDVGWSKKTATTGLCLLEWGGRGISQKSCRAGLAKDERLSKLNDLVDRKKLLTVGIDGPLAPGLEIIVQYRAAEALLSRGKFQQRGKPGPTNGGSGPRLHEHATQMAKLVVNTQDIALATYPYKIHEKAIVEAFPNAFLAFLHHEKEFPAKPKFNRRWTDTLFSPVKEKLRRLFKYILPTCTLNFDLDEINGHEEIASFLCALAALCVLSNRCVVVGERRRGYIVLPPLELWGLATDGSGPWASHVLQENLVSVRRQSEFDSAVIYKDNEVGIL